LRKQLSYRKEKVNLGIKHLIIKHLKSKCCLKLNFVDWNVVLYHLEVNWNSKGTLKVIELIIQSFMDKQWLNQYLNELLIWVRLGLAKSLLNVILDLITQFPIQC
jgi:hypothetical protein